MNPLLQEALGAILRWTLAFGAGLLVQHGIWTQTQATAYVTAGALGLLGLGWSLWQKYRNRLKLVTALASPTRLSEASLEKRIAVGAETPSVLTPKTEVPEVKL